MVGSGEVIKNGDQHHSFKISEEYRKIFFANVRYDITRRVLILLACCLRSTPLF
mgnify:CR=1 FL=1